MHGALYCLHREMRDRPAVSMTAAVLAWSLSAVGSGCGRYTDTGDSMSMRQGGMGNASGRVSARTSAAGAADVASAARNGQAAPCDAPWAFRTPVVSPGLAHWLVHDDGILKIWSDDVETDPPLHAVCIDDEGRTVGGAATVIKGQRPDAPVLAARHADGTFTVLYSTNDGEQTPLHTVFRREFGCDTGWSAPVVALGAALERYPTSVVDVGGDAVFAATSNHGITLVSSTFGGGQGIEVDSSEYGATALGFNGSELALFNTGSHGDTYFSVWRLDGSKVLSPTPLPGVRRIPASTCWDGDAWSVAFEVEENEVAYGRLESNGSWRLAPRRISDGLAHSNFPSVGCGTAGTFVTWMHSHAVLANGLRGTAIAVNQVGDRGEALFGPVDLEPVDGFSMAPTVSSGRRVVVGWGSYGYSGYETRSQVGDRCDQR